MDPWLRRMARLIGTIVGAFAGLVALQLIRLRRTTLLSHPGFSVDHIVGPDPIPGVTEPPLRMIVFGDSTTAGVGVQLPDEALPVQLARELGRRRGRRVHVTSYGWAGARAVDLVREQIPRSLEPWRPGEPPVLPTADIVVVVAGANDATHRTTPRRYRGALRAALEAIREAAPGAEVVLAGIPIFRGALQHVEPLIWLTDQYGRVLRPISRSEAARAGIAFADLAGLLPGRPPPEAFASDRFHPSAAGYAAWAQVIADALDERPIAAQGPAGADLRPAGA